MEDFDLTNSEDLECFVRAANQVLQYPSDDFMEIAKILGLDPKSDLAGANLSGVTIAPGSDLLPRQSNRMQSQTLTVRQSGDLKDVPLH